MKESKYAVKKWFEAQSTITYQMHALGGTAGTAGTTVPASWRYILIRPMDKLQPITWTQFKGIATRSNKTTATELALQYDGIIEEVEEDA